MKLRRGFKTEAEDLSLELRAELELSPSQRLDPHSLGEHLGIPILGMDEVGRKGGVADAAKILRTRSSEISAFTVFRGSARLVVHNDRHAPARQASNITHELAHCLLEHPPAPAISPEGCRYINPVVENEATWLGAALLVPRQGALELMSAGRKVVDLAAHYGVSEQLCRWRVNITGIARQLARR